MGSIALLDFRALGWVTLGERDPQRRLEPWTRGGLVIALVTGAAMFFADVARYTKNPAFIFKMAALAAALAFHFTVRRRSKAAWPAVVSLALWACVVLGGRAIADFDL